MSQLLQTIQDDLKKALKGGDRPRVETLRFLLAHLQNARIAKQADLTDEDVLGVLVKQAKMHRESIEAFGRGGRSDLVDKESRELAILEGYLPAQLDEAGVRERLQALIAEQGLAGAADLGRLMKVAMPELRGQADGGLVSRLAREELERTGA
jgi:uncharacterized protein YqeY